MKGAPLIMTVDVEDWFTSSVDLFSEAASWHGRKPDPSVERNTRRCLDLLDRHQSKATFFILTTVAETYPDLIREMERRGHEIGVHGYRHRLVYRLAPGEFEDDLKRSMDILRGIGVKNLVGYRAPYWSVTRKSLWALEILQRNGFQYDASVFPVHRRLYGIADAPVTPHEIRPGLWEYPPATARFCGLNVPMAGGGYLRMLPFFWIERMVRRARGRRPLVFYMHPYELDPQDGQAPLVLNSLKSRFYYWQQMFGRRGNPAKIERLLRLGRFTSIADAFFARPSPDSSQDSSPFGPRGAPLFREGELRESLN
jgi:polysaccharide deacetylase family protein (PEP-CTERM system associated)